MSHEPTNPPAEPRWRPLVLALGLTALFFHRAVFSAEVFFLRDIQRVYLPLRAYWRERVLGGGFPQWYPLDGLGQPYVGMVISGTFHPAQLVSLVLPGAQGYKWCVLLCFPVAFLGMNALARRLGWGARPALLAALLYTFSGYLVGITNNPPYLMAAATVPWVLWALEGFLAAPTAWRLLGSGALLALVLFSGDVQGYAVCLGGVLLWSACRLAPEGRSRSLGKALGVVGVAVLLSAVQILPTLEVVGDVRASGQTPTEAMAWSVHPVRLLEFFLGPIFAGIPGERVQMAISQRLLSTARTNLWVDSLFIGAPALLLVGVALVTHVRRPRAAVLAGAALGVLLLALGKHAGLYAWVFEWVPPWRAFRYPEKLMPFVTFSLALAAGVGLERLEREPVPPRWVGRTAFVLGALLLATGLLEWRAHVFSEVWLGGLWEGGPLLEAQQRIGGQFVLGSVLAGVSLLLFGGVLVRVRSVGMRAGLIGAVCLAGLMLANGPIYKVGDPLLLESPSPFVQRIQEESRARGGPPPRLFRLPGRVHVPESSPVSSPEEGLALFNGAALEPLVPGMFGLESTSAYMPAVSRRVITLWDAQREWFMRSAGLFGTRYLVISREFSEQVLNGPRRVVERLDAFGLLLLEDTSALPRVYLAHPRCVADAPEAVRRLGGGLQVPREVVVECETPLSEAPVEAPLGEVSAARFEPERVEVELTARGGEVLVLNDAFYAGWTASVDGTPTPILPANGAVRAVAVPPGAHRVVFSYRMPGLALGAWVSGVTLLVLLGAGLVARRVSSSAAPPPMGG
ncbi:YfhO family protein [Cystobacter fuscus]|uniref:YfhO family protein n=1 Tax=Cystobacter fuscus TaxID=43 RepID=UPI002B2E7821|nr:YfhO family protein [Cystobacter fuscus]